MIGPCELAEHHRVEAIGLAARHAEAGPRGLDLIGMQRQHDQPGVQQPLDEQPVRPLDRDAQAQDLTQPRDPGLSNDGPLPTVVGPGANHAPATRG